MSHSPQKYPPNKWIYVDVDGTLSNGGELDEAVADYCRAKKDEGYTLVMWSARGADYARDFAQRHNMHITFDHFLSKPGFVIDDKGWAWTKYTRAVPLHAIRS